MRRSILAVLAVSLALGRATAQEFSVTSRDVDRNGVLKGAQVYQGFGCEGGNVSPELTWKNPPSGTKSFAVTIYDPDAPTGSGWWHWVVFDIPSNVTHLPSGAGDPKQGLAPPGSVQARTDFGTEGYGGPCPPKGDKPHRYVFTVYALEVEKLGFGSAWGGAGMPATPGGAMVGCAMNSHVLGKTTFTARYGR